MPTIKTAISIDEQVYRRVDTLARRLHISRSQLFSRAAEAFLVREDNQALLDQLDAAYGEPPSPEETVFAAAARKRQARLLKETW